MDNSLFRSSGSRSESTRLNQYRSKLSHVPFLTSLLLLGGRKVQRSPFQAISGGDAAKDNLKYSFCLMLIRTKPPLTYRPADKHTDSPPCHRL